MGNFFSNTYERACLSSANEWYEKPTPVPIRESTSSNISTREIRENHRTQEVVVKKREDHDVELKSTSDLQKEKKKSSEGTITHYNRSSIPFSIQNGSTADVEELLAIPEKEDEEQKKRNSSTSSTTSMRWITHYNSSQKILLVGEGDFSFASCVAHAFGSASNMVATSLDSKANSKVVSMKFDRIIYNFPHAGHWRKLREEDFELIRRHKELLSGFFKNSRKLLREDGEVHVAHRDDYPYNTWGIKKLAKKAGLLLIEKVKFCPGDYPLYRNKRGSRIKGSDSFGFGDSPMTFKFSPVKKNGTY